MTLSAEQIAFLALGVSAFSVMVGTLSLIAQHRHNRLSVRPICQITYRNYADEISVSIANSGVGPLIIEKLWIAKNEKIYEEFNSLVKSVIPCRQGYYRKFIRANGKAISADSNLKIFSFDRSDDHENYDAARDAARVEMQDSEIFVQYTDIYGQKYPVTTRKLEDFAKSRKGSEKIAIEN